MNYFASFLYGALGAFLVLGVAAIIIPQYSDYFTTTETDRWLTDVAEVQSKIERRAVEINSLERAGADIPLPKIVNGPVQYLEISQDGRIYIKGGSEGQLVVLIPALEGESVVWRCIGGSTRSVAIKCRDPNLKLALRNSSLIQL